MAYTTDEIKRLIEIEARLQGVDPQLALAVATQESYLNPNAKGDGGRSLGLFQLQPAAATDAGIDPARRHEVPLNVEGGIRYLKLKLDQSGGNVEQALSRYNRGTPDYRGIGDPHYVQNVLRFYPGREQQRPPSPGLLTRVANAFSPASAEAAPSQPTGRTRLEEIEAELARRDAQPPPGATTTQAPVSQTTPTSPTPPGASQGAPAPSPADEQHAALTLAQMRQRQAPRAAITDPAALLAGGAAQGGTPTPVTDPAAALAVGGGTVSPPQTREQQLLAEARARQARGETQAVPQATAPGVPTVEQETLQETITAPSTLIPLAIGGVAGSAARTAGQAALPYVAPWLGRAAGAVPTLAEAAGNYAGRWLNVQLGYEEPGKAGDVLAVALPVGARAVGAAARAVTRNLPGAGVVRHELGEETLTGLGQRLQPRTDADTLFAQAATHNPDIATPDLWRTTGQIIRRERGFGPATRATQSLGVAQEVLDRMRASGGPLALQDLEAYRQRIGALIGTTTGQEQANLRQIYAGLMRDLESAAARNVPGAEILRGALQTRRLEHGLETLTDLWSPGKGIQLEQGDITRVYGKRILTQFQKRLHDDPLFAGSFTPAELTDIQGTLRDVARITARSPVAAPGGLLKHALSASLGTATGITTGPLAGLTTAAVVEAAPRVLAAAMRSAPGRAAIRRALDAGGGRFTAAGLGMISEAIREAASGEPTTSGPPGGPPPGR